MEHATRQEERSSAVRGVAVAEVRRCLALLRKNWDLAQSDPNRAPAYLTSDLGGPAPCATVDFALRFVMSHHERRGRRGDD